MKRAINLLCLLLASTAFAQERNYDLVDVTWSVSLDQRNRTIVGDVVNSLRPLQGNTTEIFLHAAKMEILAVAVGDQRASHRLEGDVLWITLPQPAARDQLLKVRVTYRTKPEAGVYFVTKEHAWPSSSSQVYTQGEAEDTRFWLPTYDKPDDKATSQGYITVEDGFYVLSNGALQDVTRREGRMTYHWKMDQPHVTYLISFSAGRFSEGKENWDGIPVNYYVPVGLEDQGASSFAGTWEMVKFFSDLTGYRYPYAKFTQSVVGDFPFGGMENITAVTNTIRTLHPRHEKPFASSDGLNLHELAHQWFGDTVTCKDWSHIWINEGFASLLPNFWTRDKVSLEQYEVDRYNTMMGAIGAMKGEPRPVVNTKYEVPMDNFDGHAYGGGAARMFVLHALLGDDTFWRGIKQFLTEHQFKSVDTREFFTAMSRAAGRKLDWFEKEWFYTAATPKIKVERDGATLKVTQLADADFSMNVPVWFWVGNGWQHRTVPITGRTASIQLEPDLRNAPFLADPETVYISEIEYGSRLSESEIETLYPRLLDAGARARLVDLAMSYHYKDLPKKLLGVEKAAVLRRKLASLLPATETDLLVELSHEDDPLTRREVVNRMAQGPAADAVLTRLMQLWGTEKSDLFKRDILAARVALTKDASLASHAWTMNGHEDVYRVWALGWYSENKPDEARELALKAIDEGQELLRNEAISRLGRLKDKAGERRVFNALVKVLHEPGHRSRQSAMNALREYGDKAAIAEVSKYLDYGMYQVRNQARDVVKALEG